MKKLALLFFVLSWGSISFAADDQEIQELRKQIAELKERVTQLEKLVGPATIKAQAGASVEKQRLKARERMRADNKVYSQAELGEIEALYQVANKKWQSDEGKNSLKDLIKKFDKANRTGCALLYLGQMSNGSEKEEYLTEAIADFSDCWYGDGVQVGAFARLLLANHYQNSKQPEKSRVLLEELKQGYPDAIDHQGKLLADLTNAE